MPSTHDEPVGDRLQELLERHPSLFVGRQFEISADLPAGWFEIADRMCTDLEQLLGDAASRFQPIQSKEKFGSWRFYWRLDPMPGENEDDVDDDGSDGTTPFDMDLTVAPGVTGADAVPRLAGADTEVEPTVAGFRLSVLPRGKLRRAIFARVRQAERETERACMWCGEPATAWTTGWIHVACAKHRRRGAITAEEALRRLEARQHQDRSTRRKPTKDGDGK
jgi:hypothetical protein